MESVVLLIPTRIYTAVCSFLLQLWSKGIRNMRLNREDRTRGCEIGRYIFRVGVGVGWGGLGWVGDGRQQMVFKFCEVPNTRCIGCQAA